MARYQFTQEDRRKGGKTRAAQPSFRDAQSEGFWTTIALYPNAKFLKAKIKGYNQAKGQYAPSYLRRSQ